MTSKNSSYTSCENRNHDYEPGSNLKTENTKAINSDGKVNIGSSESGPKMNVTTIGQLILYLQITMWKKWQSLPIVLFRLIIAIYSFMGG